MTDSGGFLLIFWLLLRGSYIMPNCLKECVDSNGFEFLVIKISKQRRVPPCGLQGTYYVVCVTLPCGHNYLSTT